jgi:hypothetical protein
MFGKKEKESGEKIMDKKEKAVSDFDQYITFVLRTIPSSLWMYYNALQTEGFSEERAFQLTMEYQRMLSCHGR